MKPIRDKVIFTLEKETEDEYRLANGEAIYIETKFDPAKHARQYGKVVSVAPHIERYKEFKDGIELMEGDKVWMHHFAIEKTKGGAQPNKFIHDGNPYYVLSYSMFFAVERHGHFVPLGEFVFVRPKVVDKDYGGLTNPLMGNLSRKYAEVVYINRFCKRETGLEVGDTVALSGTGVYEMKIGGETLYRMRMRQLVAVRREVEIDG